MAKFFSAIGSARILQSPDPILAISFQNVLLIAAAIEMAVALICFFGSRTGLQASLVAWSATSFLLYRFGLLWIGYHGRCNCLGSLTDELHIPPDTADSIMKAVLAYLFIGSYATLFSLWKQKRTLPPATPLTEAANAAL